MQALLEFAPLLAFMGAYYVRDLYFATAVLMGAMLALLAVDYLRTRRIPPMHLLSTILVLVFGSATLILRNPQFIQWKPTILLWIMAGAFAVSSVAGKEPLAQRLLKSVAGEHGLPRPLWLRLNWLWVGFCLLAGLANILAAWNLSERVWVNFHGIGLSVAMVLFMLPQAVWLARRAEVADRPAADPP